MENLIGRALFIETIDDRDKSVGGGSSMQSICSGKGSESEVNKQQRLIRLYAVEVISDFLCFSMRKLYRDCRRHRMSEYSEERIDSWSSETRFLIQHLWEELP